MNKEIGTGDLTGRFVLNLGMNLTSLLAVGIIGLLMVPFYIDSLGIASYGIIPVCVSVAGYVAVVCDAASNSVFRYLSVPLRIGDREKAEKVYSTAFGGMAFSVAVLIPAVLIVSYLSVSMFDVGGNDATSVRLLFLGVLGSVLITLLGNTYGSVLMSCNRLDLQSMVRIVQTVCQAAIIVITFDIGSTSVQWIGAAYAVTATGCVLLAYLASRSVCPFLHLHIHDFSLQEAKKILGIESWNLVNMAGNLFFLQMCLILANVLYGSIEAGILSVAISLVSMMVSLTAAVSSAFAPIMMVRFSENGTDAVNRLCISAVKITGLTVAPFIAYICVFSTQILKTWVGDGFGLENILLIMLLFMTFSNL